MPKISFHAFTSSALVGPDDSRRYDTAVVNACDDAIAARGAASKCTSLV
jgi:hypothetical protein